MGFHSLAAGVIAEDLVDVNDGIHKLSLLVNSLSNWANFARRFYECRVLVEGISLPATIFNVLVRYSDDLVGHGSMIMRIGQWARTILIFVVSC